jgi:uncharacterized protein YoxC
MRQPSFVRRTLGASALSLMFLPASAFAEDPPAEPAEDLSTAVKQVAEQAVETAQEAAIEAAEEAHKAAEQAQKAAEDVAKEAEKAAHDAIKQAKRHGELLNIDQGYQLDLHVTVVSAVLNAQLKLDGKGVLVDSVEKDGPAGKAGIQAFDVLMFVDDKPLAGAKDLYKAVQASEGKEIAVKLIRSGETQTVKVTPVKHPHRGNLNLDFNSDVSEEVDIVVGKLEENIREKLKQAGLDVRLQMIRPGHVLPNTFIKTTRIPDDLVITIRKQGEEPAEIEAKQGEQAWSIKEGELEKLPPEVRPHVQRMLGHGPMPFTIALPGKPGLPIPPVRIDMADGKTVRAERIHIVEPGATPRTAERRRGSLEHRLEQMNKSLERMNEQMQALQRELGKSSTEEDEEEIEIEIRKGEDKDD